MHTLSQVNCAEECPCGELCPNGCDDCEYCACLIPEENYDWQFCHVYYEVEEQTIQNFKFLSCNLIKTFIKVFYLQCIERCQHEEPCLGECNREYYQHLKTCPCDDYCPNGCPCEGAFEAPSSDINLQILQALIAILLVHQLHHLRQRRHQLRLQQCRQQH